MVGERASVHSYHEPANQQTTLLYLGLTFGLGAEWPSPDLPSYKYEYS